MDLQSVTTDAGHQSPHCCLSFCLAPICIP